MNYTLTASNDLHVSSFRVAHMAMLMCDWKSSEEIIDSERVRAADKKFSIFITPLYNTFVLDNFSMYKAERARVLISKQREFEEEFRQDLATARAFIAEVAQLNLPLTVWQSA